jgi:hypothetical protein
VVGYWGSILRIADSESGGNSMFIEHFDNQLTPRLDSTTSSS